MTANQQKTSKSSKPEYEEQLAIIEAALYVAGRPLDVKTLGSIIKLRSKKKIQAMIRTLIQRYLTQKGALELIELDNERVILQLKPKYVQLVRRLAMQPLLTASPLKTLAYIAYRQPVTQAHVVAVRGAHVYSHIRKIRNLGLIKTEKLGKTYILRTTEVFADYFNLSHNTRLMKRQLKALFDSVAQETDKKNN
jgi:segregation and condensation protein B